MDMGKTIAKAHRLSQIYITNALKGLDIKSSLYMYILCICENEGMSQEELAAELKVDKSAAAKATKQLMEDGIFMREANQSDKRAYKIYPTAKAKEHYSKIKQAEHDCRRELLKNMTDTEADIFLLLLQKLDV